MNASEEGVRFKFGDESTYPPEYTFVVTNLLPNVPVYYDRKANRWWTPIADKFGGDIYGRDDMGDTDDEVFWQPIEFKKARVLLIPAASE